MQIEGRSGAFWKGVLSVPLIRQKNPERFRKLSASRSTHFVQNFPCHFSPTHLTFPTNTTPYTFAPAPSPPLLRHLRKCTRRTTRSGRRPSCTTKARRTKMVRSPCSPPIPVYVLPVPPPLIPLVPPPSPPPCRSAFFSTRAGQRKWRVVLRNDNVGLLAGQPCATKVSREVGRRYSHPSKP